MVTRRYFYYTKRWLMKSFAKNLIPEVHVNPFYLDLLVVTSMGLLVAFALVSIAFILFH